MRRNHIHHGRDVGVFTFDSGLVSVCFLTIVDCTFSIPCCVMLQEKWALSPKSLCRILLSLHILISADIACQNVSLSVTKLAFVKINYL